MSNKWSTKEIALLERYYPTTSLDVLQKLFFPDKDVKVISKKAGNLHLKKEINIQRFVHNKEIDKVIELYNSGKNTYKIAFICQRSRKTIVEILKNNKDKLIKK